MQAHMNTPDTTLVESGKKEKNLENIKINE